MGYYVIVDANGRKVTYRPTNRESYSTEAAAKAAVTRMKTPGLRVMTGEAYRAQVPMKKVRNMMSGVMGHSSITRVWSRVVWMAVSLRPISRKVR